MIIDKPIDKGSVITVKLISGEELLARFDSETDQHIVVSKPSVIAATADNIGLVPWMISAQTRNVKLNKSAVVTYVATDEELAKNFINATSSIMVA